MRIKDYQNAVKRTMTNGEGHLANFCMGLAGESGEIIDMVKKFMFHGHELDRQEAIKELGDVFWYLSAISNELNIDLEEVADTNIAKLKKRYPNGFSKEASINRVE